MKELSLEQYQQLPYNDQYDFVFKHAEFVDVVVEGNTKYALYSLFKFFVEVEYKVSENKIMAIDSFIDGEKLNRHSKF